PWCDSRACFVPGHTVQPQTSNGAANGEFDLRNALCEGTRAGQNATHMSDDERASPPAWDTPTARTGRIEPLWLTATGTDITRGPKQFIDFQNDVSTADIHLAVREGYHSVEHVKRYTAMGFG